MEQTFAYYKRIIHCAIILVLTGYFAFAQTSNPPVAHWKFDETSGTAISDVSGNGHNGTLMDATTDTPTTTDTLWVTGKKDGCLEFDDEVYMDVPSFDQTNADGSFSVAFWMNTTVTKTDGEDNTNDWWKGIFMFDKDKGNNGWGLTNHYSKLVFNCVGVKIISPTKIDDGVWHHVVLGRTSDGTAYVYVDGVETVNSGDNKSTTAITNPDNFTIGGANQDGRYIGMLDDLRFYNYSLTVAEVTALAEVPATNQLVAHWKFDETSGTTISDVSGNGHNGTLMDATTDTPTTTDTLWVTGKKDGCLEFDDEVYMDVPSFDQTNADGSFSVAFWMNTTVTKTDGEDNTNDWWKGIFMFDKDKGNNGWGLTNHYSKLVFNCVGVKIISPTKIDDGVWHHVVLGRTSDGTAYVYVDGVETVNSGDNKSTTAITNPDNFTIGGANQDGRYIGMLDDLRFYNYSLTVDEVTALAEVPAANQLVAHWKFDETSGTTISDVSGNGHNGTLMDATTDTPTTTDTLWVTGKKDGCLEFDDEVYMDVPNFDQTNADGSFSVAFWMNTTVTKTDGEDNTNDWWKGIFMFDKDKGNNGWGLTNHYSKLVFNCVGVKIISPTKIDDGVWHHVVLGRTSDGTAYIYVDGVETVNSGDNKSTTAITNPDNFTIGGANQDGRYIGMLDDLRFYNYSLSVDEIAALAVVTSVKENKLAGYELNQNYPNPIGSNGTTITYILPSTSHVNINVYNISGQMIKTLVNAEMRASSYTVRWDGRNDAGRKLPGGIYYYTMKVNNVGHLSRKMILMR